jgi:hypothetical protein
MPVEEYRTWRLCTLMRCRPSDLEGESAIALDWLLAVDDAVAVARKNKEEAAQNG